MNSRGLVIGIWIELSRTALSDSKGEGIVKWTREISHGICQLDEVSQLCIPTERESVPLLQNLLADRDGRIPEKLKLVDLVSNCFARNDLHAAYLASLQSSLQVFQELDCNFNPYRWFRAALMQASQNRKWSRKFRSFFKTIRRLSKSTFRILSAKCKYGVRKLLLSFRTALSSKPAPIHVDLWIVPYPQWTGVLEHRGKRIVTIPDLAYLEFDLSEIGKLELNRRHQQVLEAMKNADAIACYSTHVKQKHLQHLVDETTPPIYVIPHGYSSTQTSTGPRKALNQMELANRFREYFRDVRPCRYFCDFPLENCQYLFVSSKCRPYKNYQRVLEAYEQILRRHRCNLKLIVTGQLSGNASLNRTLKSRGLIYDVIECTNIDEAFHEGLIANASAFVIPTLFEGGFPFGFSEAVSLGVPAVMSRIPVTIEQLGSVMSSPEYFDPTDVDDMVRSILYAIDHRALVQQNQREALNAMAKRDWKDVASEFVHCID